MADGDDFISSKDNHGRAMAIISIASVTLSRPHRHASRQFIAIQGGKHAVQMPRMNIQIICGRGLIAIKLNVILGLSQFNQIGEI